MGTVAEVAVAVGFTVALPVGALGAGGVVGSGCASGGFTTSALTSGTAGSRRGEVAPDAGATTADCPVRFASVGFASVGFASVGFALGSLVLGAAESFAVALVAASAGALDWLTMCVASVRTGPVEMLVAEPVAGAVWLWPAIRCGPA